LAGEEEEICGEKKKKLTAESSIEHSTHLNIVSSQYFIQAQLH
jgi:hypothetical protein